MIKLEKNITILIIYVKKLLQSELFHKQVILPVFLFNGF